VSRDRRGAFPASPNWAPPYHPAGGCRKLRQGATLGPTRRNSGQDVSEIRQLARRLASRGGTSCAAHAGVFGALRRRVARCRGRAWPGRRRLGSAAGGRVKNALAAGAWSGVCTCWMVDTTGPSARLGNLKKRVFSRGSTVSGSFPPARPGRPWRGDRSRLGPLWKPRTGTPMQVASSPLRCLSMRADELHRDANPCSQSDRQRAARARAPLSSHARGMRHGSCLLVHAKVALPAGGGVNEEMAA
jgi:hypothetical protein